MKSSLCLLGKVFSTLFFFLAAVHPGFADDSANSLNPETQYTLPSGASFNVPKGWDVQAKGGSFILHDPEHLVTLVLTENEEISPQDALQKAWKSYNPDFSYAVATHEFPKRDKWDQVCRQWYFVPSEQDPYKANDTRGLYAFVGKKDDRWYVALMDYDKVSADKRQAQVEVIIGSLKIPGAKPTPTPAQDVQMDDKFFKTFEDFLEHARNDCKVPGAAVAIVKDGKIVYEKGFGVCEKGKKDPVTTKTLFSISGITVPLTTLLMARLVDAGKMSWDTPVTQLLPGFQLGDPKTTSELTLKYTVCACAGLARQDPVLVFPTGYSSPETVIEKMLAIMPTAGFGEIFQSSNILVATGGFAAAHALHPDLPLGQAYAAAMKEYVFDPLGMADTTLDFQSVAAKEHGTPHCYVRDYDYDTVPLAYDDWTLPVAPAVGAWSNVEDMSKYLLLELNKGIGPDGTRVVSEANLLKRREPHVKINEDSDYGLGLKVLNDKGITVVGQGGISTGYTSDMVFMPDRNMGMVLLTNADYAGYFRGAVYQKLMELISGREAHAQENLDSELSTRRKQGQILADWANSQMSQSWFYDFVGTYFNEDLGAVSLKMTNEGGIFDAGKWKTHVAGTAGRNGETKFYLTDPPIIWSQFILNDQDGHKTMTYKTSQKDYVFEWVSKNQ